MNVRQPIGQSAWSRAPGAAVALFRERYLCFPFIFFHRRHGGIARCYQLPGRKSTVSECVYVIPLLFSFPHFASHQPQQCTTVDEENPADATRRHEGLVHQKVSLCFPSSRAIAWLMASLRASPPSVYSTSRREETGQILSRSVTQQANPLVNTVPVPCHFPNPMKGE
jgi:hypothetical protein